MVRRLVYPLLNSLCCSYSLLLNELDAALVQLNDAKDARLTREIGGAFLILP